VEQLRDIHHQPDLVQLVQQEVIAQLHFPKQEVLFQQHQVVKRTEMVANLMGQINSKKLIVSIFFEDIAGAKKVNAVVHSVRNNELILSAKISIPLHRITHIQLQENNTHSSNT